MSIPAYKFVSGLGDSKHLQELDSLYEKGYRATSMMYMKDESILVLMEWQVVPLNPLPK
jgi:hypothetical protein